MIVRFQEFDANLSAQIILEGIKGVQRRVCSLQSWLANCKLSGQVRMKTVQVAIQDPVYADSVRELLVRDGKHEVHLVERPEADLGGVIIVDTAHLDGLPSLPNVQERLVVVVNKDHDDLFRIWDAGVRHVLFQGDPPQTARVVVLGVELSIGSGVRA